jgi:hypothetical protein
MHQQSRSQSERIKSSESLDQWRSRVSSIQRLRQDPASIAAAEERSQSKLRMKKNAQKAKRLQTVQVFAKCSNAGTMASFRSSSKTSQPTSSSSFSAPLPNQQQQQQQVLSSFGAAAADFQTMEETSERAQLASRAMKSLQMATNVDLDEDEADGLIEEARLQLHHAGHAWASEGVEGAYSTSNLLTNNNRNSDDDDEQENNDTGDESNVLNDLLSDLKTEPTDDEDCMRRFKLYEEHTETVSIVRKSLFSFWSSVEKDIPQGQAKESIQSSLNNVDNQENLEVYIDPKYWFVYSMAKKVTSNENKIERVLSNIQTKLELLASTVDCPICLEAIEPNGDDEHVFGCAHKIHQECWEHWSAHCKNIHKSPFCPLCKNDEFLEDILS